MADPVKITGLSFAYRTGLPVLKSVSLDIRAGEKFGIIGPSGSGKSTLLLHMNGILRGEGIMEIGDLPVTSENLARIRRRVGLVFQNPDDQLFNPTVEEDVAFGPLNFGHSPEEVKEKVSFALRAMNLEGFEKRISHHLSFGERKRVALATVLAMQPRVIAFDEPFSNLDPAMVSQLIGLMKAMEPTLIIASQSILPLLDICTRIAILHDGEIKTIGTPAEIVSDKSLLKASGLDIGFYFDICRRFESLNQKIQT
ncbi:MAG: energy-coupling factor ABC transporter ATP-binding protein [Bacteroidales bacterium]|jgi:cobalt/nickel transport system ATP-binding protein|nr:energy-coupling factor ABC transporter ATP-binding protein [Bacteroidales bacterium]MCU0407380.1 energy-coupling factor ABC transporter ATP-binding protein [Bacteroidales bacterium]